MRVLLVMVVWGVVGAEAACKVVPLESRRVIVGDTVMSATVKSFYMRGSGGPFAGKVKVRRVFRGDQGLEGRTVMVEGLGSGWVGVAQ